MPPDDRSSADPLAAIGGDDPAAPEIAQIWTRWLAAELLDDQYARLEQAGSTPDTGIPLARIFIDVAASREGAGGDERDAEDASTGGEEGGAAVRPGPGLLSELLAVAALPRDEREEIAGGDEDESVRLARGMRRIFRETRRRTLLIGGPGQGKSTLVQYLCQLHRVEVLRSRYALLSAPQQQTCDVISNQATSDGLPRPSVPCVPLRIILRDFAAWMFRGKIDAGQALVRFIAERMTRMLQTTVEAGAVHAALMRIPWLLVLDGLDEVPASAGRGDILDAVRALLESPLARTPHLVVATTRPQGYGGELGSFQAQRLLGLSRTRALGYASRLVEARYPGQVTRHQEILERLTMAWNEPTGRRLMRTPLQVSVMVALVAQVGRAPADRWRLFSDYYRVMYQREVERPNLVQAELLRTLRKQIDEIHRLAGLWLQTRSEHAGETDALLSQEELARLIDTVLERNGHDDAEERRSLVRQIFDAAVDRLVFLVPGEAGKYGFEIRSLQELMAAEALLTGGDAEVTRRLRHIAPLDPWRNVFLFAAGKCFADTWHLAPVIVDDICPWLNDGHEDPAVRSSLTGSEIALDLIEDGAARNQPKLARSLAVLALRLLELPPSAVQWRLAGIGILEFEGSLHQALVAHLSLAEPERRLSAWSTLVPLADGGMPWATDMADERWPNEGQRRREIVEAVNKAGVTAGRWLQARMAEALGDFPPDFVRTAMFDIRADMPLAWLVAARPDDEHPVRGAQYPLLMDGVPTKCSIWLMPYQASAWHLAPFIGMHDPPAVWLPLVVAARLLDSPSAATLAEGLRALAAAWEPHAWAELRWDLPWPLGQALMMARDADALRMLAAAVETGTCGDQLDWGAAEGQWLQGVRFESLLAMDSTWPTKDRLESSFPIAVAWLGWPSNARWDREILDRAVAAYRGAPPEKRAIFAHLVDRFISVLWLRTRRAPSAIQPEEIRDIWTYVGRPPLAAAIAHLVPASLDIKSWVALMDDVGNARPSGASGWMGNILPLFVNWYTHAPDSSGLLRLVALSLTSFFFRREVPREVRMIEPARFPAGSRPRFDAALLRLMADQDDVEASTWLTLLVDSLPIDPKEAAIAGFYLEGRREGAPLAPPAHLVELLTRLPPHGWRLGAAAVESLLDHRKRRVSALDDPTTWARLGLPLPAPTKSVSSRPPPRPLHAQIDAVHLENLRAFDTIDLPIPVSSENKTSGRWITLLGENGTGKTTLLRSIALALTDPSLADTIVKASPAPYITHDAERGLVRVEASGTTFSARISHGSAATEELEGDAASERPLLFAYGCRRGSALGGAARAVSFKPYEAIATLFEEGAGLIHAETWLKERALAAKEKDAAAAKVLFEAIRQALVRILPGVKRIDVKAEGVWVEGPAVGRSMLEGLSDGYVSTMGWVLDLIARWIDHKERTKEPIGPDIFEEMEGIVLVDEIDLHLHPRWQVRVIDDVRRLFPRMTFIVTTHNPLTLLGAQAGEVIVLRRSEVEVEGDEAAAPVSPRTKTRIEAAQQDIPPGLTVDQVLTGAWFGLASTLDKDTLALLEQHRTLLREGAGRDDPKRLALEAELRQRLGGFADTSLERMAQSVAAQVLPEQATELGPGRRERLKKRILETVAAETEATTSDEKTPGPPGKTE